MASIRRTLSPVPQARTIQNGEAHSVPSPLSKSSSHTQNHAPSGGLMSTMFGLMESNPILYRIQAVLLGIFSQRSSRPLERSKSKGPVWRKAFFNFFIFFTVGSFIGFMPFFSTNFSQNLMSKNQTFLFEAIPVAGKAGQYDGTLRNGETIIGHLLLKDNSSSEMEPNKQELINEISDDNSDAQLPIQDSDLLYRKLLIIVTPTYTRPFQAYYLNRLAQTLRLVPPPLLWIVVEMSSQSTETADILRKTGVMYRHLVCDKNITSIRVQGVHQRNVALSHIEKHHLDGILYFADDNNMYSLDLFEQMREIRRFGTWPVAMLTDSKNKAMVVGSVCNGSQVIGWHVNDRNRRFRRFHSEISGFAFNSTILWDAKRWHRPTLEPIRQLDTVRASLQVSTFIEQVVEDESQMEGLPSDCSRIMVWDLPLEASLPLYPRQWLMKKSLDVISPLKVLTDPRDLRKNE
ncbi:Glycosyl transferase [Macleaya cordata]|uniref:Glycosyltransferases n=1 Tax=Macleaya cordata TaxID=56857 RepID=A0A200RC76_MACCD|nr:Glycosyl transferase [Macleaya cordata]